MSDLRFQHLLDGESRTIKRLANNIVRLKPLKPGGLAEPSVLDRTIREMPEDGEITCPSFLTDEEKDDFHCYEDHPTEWRLPGSPKRNCRGSNSVLLEDGVPGWAHLRIRSTTVPGKEVRFIIGERDDGSWFFAPGCCQHVAIHVCPLPPGVRATEEYTKRSKELNDLTVRAVGHYWSGENLHNPPDDLQRVLETDGYNVVGQLRRTRRRDTRRLRAHDFRDWDAEALNRPDSPMVTNEREPCTVFSQESVHNDESQSTDMVSDNGDGSSPETDNGVFELRRTEATAAGSASNDNAATVERVCTHNICKPHTKCLFYEYLMQAVITNN